MGKVVPLRRTERRSGLAELCGPDEAKANRGLWAHVLIFSAIALILYAAAIAAIPGEAADRLWLLGLILVIAISKLVAAGGLMLGIVGADRHADSTRESDVGAFAISGTAGARSSGKRVPYRGTPRILRPQGPRGK